MIFSSLLHLAPCFSPIFLAGLSSFGFSNESNPITSTPTTSQGAQQEGTGNNAPTVQSGSSSSNVGANSTGSTVLANSTAAAAGSTGSFGLQGNASIKNSNVSTTTNIMTSDPEAIAGITNVSDNALLDNATVASEAEQDVSALSNTALESYQAQTADQDATVAASEQNAIGAVTTNVGNALATVDSTTLASLQESNNATANADQLVGYTLDSQAATTGQALSLAGDIAGQVSGAITNGNATADSLLEELTTQYAAGLNQSASNSETVANNAVAAAQNTLTAGVAPSQNLQGINQANTSGISPNTQKIAFYAGLTATALALYYYIVKKQA